MTTRRTGGGLLSEQDLIEQEIASAVQWFEEKLRLQIAGVLAVCESPIERVFATAMVTVNETEAVDKAHISLRRVTEVPEVPFDGLHIYPQAGIDGYRLDFLAAYKCGDEFRLTVVELDGHDFHERTKHQASHDKRRDRHFTKKGWQVLRYTGSDVWRNPVECAREMLLTAQGYGEEA